MNFLDKCQKLILKTEDRLKDNVNNLTGKHTFSTFNRDKQLTSYDNNGIIGDSKFDFSGQLIPDEQHINTVNQKKENNPPQSNVIKNNSQQTETQDTNLSYPTFTELKLIK
jgi:hypothetical protein